MSVVAVEYLNNKVDSETRHLRHDIKDLRETIYSDLTDIHTTLNDKVNKTSPIINGHELKIDNEAYTITFPQQTDTLVTLTGNETLKNKTLTTPEISSIKNGSATLTLPSTTGILARTDDIPSLSGYATQSYVTSQHYATESYVTTKLDDYATKSALNNKVDKITGETFATQSYVNTVIGNLSIPEEQDLTGYVTKANTQFIQEDGTTLNLSSILEDIENIRDDLNGLKQAIQNLSNQ